MPRLTLVTTATPNPMGAEVYQEEIASRASVALGEEWTVHRTIVRSLRAKLEGNRRLPMGFVQHASPDVRRLIGRALYPSGVVHRMNLELPPSPNGDVVTLHDIVAWRFPDEAPPVPAAVKELRRADAVICVSEFSAQEAIDLIGIRNPVVVHNGVAPAFFDAAPLDESELSAMGIQGPYLMAAGGAARRKNLPALAAAWPHIHQAHPDLTLVLSGPPHPVRTELFGGLKGVRTVGRVDAGIVPGLMAAARGVVVPSLYEGFGLPALEAMAARTPLVAANTSALPEVVGNGGLLVEPTPEGLIEGILNILSGSSEVAALVERGRTRASNFTWEVSAASHARVWHSVV